VNINHLNLGFDTVCEIVTELIPKDSKIAVKKQRFPQHIMIKIQSKSEYLKGRDYR
jgi:hypothetical protein